MSSTLALALALLLQGPGEAPTSRPLPPPAPPVEPLPASRPVVPAPAAEMAARVQAELAALTSADADRREQAIQRLVELVEPCRDLLVKALSNPDWRVRHALLRVFRMHPVPEVGTAFEKLLTDEVVEVREQAVIVYAQHQPDDWLEQLTAVLQRETEARVLRQALNAIGGSHHPDAVPLLCDFFERTDDPYLRKRTLGALRSLCDDDFGTDMAAWRRWHAEHKAQREHKGGG